MEDPARDINRVIRALCQGTPEEQLAAVHQNFLPDASFVHPFCRVPSLSDVHVPGVGTVNSRTFILGIFKWYKMLSPEIRIKIESSVYDPHSQKLYLDISQTFAVWFIPFYRAPVRLVTVLDLVPRRPTKDAASSRQPPPPPHKGPELDGPSYAKVAAASSEEAQSMVSSAGGGEEDTSPGPRQYMIAKQEDLYQVNEFLKFIVPLVGAPGWFAWQVLSTMMCLFGVLVCWPVLSLLGMTGIKTAKRSGHKIS